MLTSKARLPLGDRPRPQEGSPRYESSLTSMDNMIISVDTMHDAVEAHSCVDNSEIHL